MNKKAVLVVIVLTTLLSMVTPRFLFPGFTGQQDKTTKPAKPGKPATPVTIGHTIQIKSDVLKENRDVFVSLPLDYQKSKKPCPVIYLLDGNWTFLYSAGLIQYLSETNKIPRMIVVGVTHHNRFKDLSYHKDIQVETICGAEDFLEFMETELMPYIAKHYRTTGWRALLGHSLGAMFTLHTMIRKPELFNAYFAISPNFTRDVSLLPLWQKKLGKIKLDGRFLFVSSEKFASAEIKKTYETFKTLLEKQTGGLRWSEEYLPDENHPSVGPISLLLGLKALFSDYESTGRMPGGK